MSPSNDELWSLLGEAAFSTGEAEVAENAFRRVLDLRGPHFETLIYLGNSAAELGHWGEAEDALKRARTMAPESFLPHFALGGVELRRGDHRHAADHLEASLDRDETPQALYLLGNCRLQLGETGRAVTALKRAIEIDPTFEEAIDRLGEAYLSRGWTNRALETYRRLERQDPQRLLYRETVRLLSSPPPDDLPKGTQRLLERAEQAVAAGRLESALDLFETASRAEGGEPGLHATAALLASILGRTRQAVAHARRVLRNDPDGSPFAAAATAALLESLRSAGRLRTTHRLADAIYSNGADDFCRGIAAYELALVQSELDGDLRQARALARESLERMPTELRRFPLVALASIALRRGRLHEARSYLERATNFGDSSRLSHFGDPHFDVLDAPEAQTNSAEPSIEPGIDSELLQHIRRLANLARTLARS